MCGITGYFHFNKERKGDAHQIKKMADTLSHRGPDGEGFFISDNLALGHRRLSIIDLQTGDQPMHSANGKIVIIFNGEIYNYVELRDELRKEGAVFRTASDTEVIIQSYIRWGTDCLSRFNGCWSFALWDENKQQLFLSRDRLGEKPLFYAVYDNTFIFGSEIKSLLAYGIPKIPAIEYTELYLSLGYIPAPFTYYKNITKLMPGHSLIVNNNGCKDIKYWDLPTVDEAEMLTNKIAVYDEFDHLLKDSVNIRMRSDVPYGAFLSGGLDSSSVVALMSALSSYPVETFTVGFENRAFDERHLAGEVVSAFHTNHHTKVIDQDSFEIALQTITQHYDEPYGDSSAIAVGNIADFAGEKVKMVLTGDGGDEVLSGYNSYLGLKYTSLYRKIPVAIRKQIPPVTNKVASLFNNDIRYKLNRISRVCKTGNLDFTPRMIEKMAWTEIQDVKKIVSALPGNQVTIEDYFSDLLKQCQFTDEFYRLMFLNLKLSLPDDMLTKVDRMTMAHSLEARIPFLDHRLVEFMYKVHKSVKLPGSERKSVLRNTVAKRLPQAVLKSPKQGFVVPVREWFKDRGFSNKLSGLVNNSIGLDRQAIEKVVSENKNGYTDNGNFIWMLFVLQNWFNK
jgi:asparagine synthase (glutamine-hydrolysing)